MKAFRHVLSHCIFTIAHVVGNSLFMSSTSWATVYRTAVRHCVRVGVRTSPPCDTMFYSHTHSRRRDALLARAAAAAAPKSPFVKTSKRARAVAPSRFLPQRDAVLPHRIAPTTAAEYPVHAPLSGSWARSARRIGRPLEKIWGVGDPVVLRQCHRLTMQQTRAQPVLFLFDQLFESGFRIPVRMMRKRAMRQAYGLFRQQV